MILYKHFNRSLGLHFLKLGSSSFSWQFCYPFSKVHVARNIRILVLLSYIKYGALCLQKCGLVHSSILAVLEKNHLRVVTLLVFEGIVLILVIALADNGDDNIES